MGPSQCQIYILRLKPEEDLKKALQAYAQEKNLKAAFILSCAGSLQEAYIRLANQEEPTHVIGKMEIVSLSGTLFSSGLHLHISLSDQTGKTIGGHLLDGSKIFTTAEIVIGEALDLEFMREFDNQTGCKELKILQRKTPTV